MFLLIFKAFISGLFVSAPAGPVGILSIKNNLLKRGRSGIATGIGAAIADFIYAALAIFSVGALFGFIDIHKGMLQIVAGIIVILFGAKELFLIKKTDFLINKKKINLREDFLSGFFITIINPITLISFFAIFALLGLGENLRQIDSIVIIFSVFLGSIFAWITLNYIVIKIKKRNKKITEKKLKIISKISGIILIFMGILLFTKGLFQ